MPKAVEDKVIIYDMSWVVVVALVFAVAFASCGAGVPLFCRFTGQSPYSSIAQIKVGGGQGSGTLIAISDDEALVLSCRHVAESVDAAAKFEWLGVAGQITTGRAIAVVPGQTFNNDLSLFVTSIPDGAKPVLIAKFDPENGPWRCVGWRGGQMYEAVADVGEEKDGLITFNSPWIQGQSGGPCFDKNNCIVGVIVGSDLKTYGVAADGKYLQELIRAHSN